MRWAICNEIFADRPLEAGLDAIADAGYAAVELAPFTLAEEPARLDRATRRRIRAAIEARGLGVTGLHWLLAGTRGLHVADPDEGVRRATVDHLRVLTELCLELGGCVLVFGSPAQRSTPPGTDPRDAAQRAEQSFAEWAEEAERSGAVICLEALPADETDYLTTTEETLALVERLASPAVRMVLDVKSMSSEPTPISAQIRRAAAQLHYVQANDANRGGPGFGATDFVPIFAALEEVGYRGDVSVEAFDLAPGRERVARESLRYLRASAVAAGWSAVTA